MTSFGKLQLIRTAFSLLSVTRIVATIECTSPCNCRWILDILHVDCSHSSLNDSPVFGDLPIEYLDLSNNDLNKFPDQLSSLKSLSYLDLSHNKISYFDHDALVGFAALQTLLLCNNSIQSWMDILPGTVLRAAIHLEHLNLNGNNFGRYNDNNPVEVLFSNSLKRLSLESCGITDVSGGILIHSLPNLEELNLSNNPLTSITRLASDSLRRLALNNCNLEYLDIRYFPRLENLQMAYNPKLQSRVLTDMSSANVLNLLNVSFCNLDSIDLSKLQQMKTAILAGNLLRSLSTSLVGNNSKLEVVDLSRNALRFIDPGTFESLPQLVDLNLSFNEISYLDQRTFIRNPLLLKLDLSHNVFEQLTKLSSESIVEINLSWCQIVRINKTVISEVSRLQRLDLSNNNLPNFPDGIQSSFLRSLDLSNCKLSNIDNTTFSGFPDLVSLRLHGNRFTNFFSPEYFTFNPHLKDIWIGDNPWICSCNDPTFTAFYEYLTTTPAKLRDRYNTRCASPASYYGKTWETACTVAWTPSTKDRGHFWSSIMIVLVLTCVILFCCTCIKKYMHKRKERHDESEYRNNTEEMREVRRHNQCILNESGSPNAPDAFETTLPSYEDAIRMPKPVRPVKSMDDLSSSSKTRLMRQYSRIRSTNQDIHLLEQNVVELLLDNKQRFHSQEMLANRDKERTNRLNPIRRRGHVNYNTGSRNLSAEETRFPPAHVKQQNLQSAEKISSFHGCDSSPYSKRKPKLQEIPPFKRAYLKANSVEFCSDSEFDIYSTNNSPFAKRKPSSHIAAPTLNMCDSTTDLHSLKFLDPAVDDYFGDKKKSSSSSIGGSDYQMLVEADISYFPDNHITLHQPEKHNNDQPTISVDNLRRFEREAEVIKVEKPLHETLF